MSSLQEILTGLALAAVILLLVFGLVGEDDEIEARGNEFLRWYCALTTRQRQQPTWGNLIDVRCPEREEARAFRLRN